MSTIDDETIEEMWKLWYEKNSNDVEDTSKFYGIDVNEFYEFFRIGFLMGKDNKDTIGVALNNNQIEFMNGIINITNQYAGETLTPFTIMKMAQDVNAYLSNYISRGV